MSADAFPPALAATWRTSTPSRLAWTPLRNAFVMAHVNRYKAGVVTLGAKAYISAHQGISGILIEEHTAVMIRRGQITRLIGNGRAGIVDGGSHGTDSVVWLSGTARYDPPRREFAHGCSMLPSRLQLEARRAVS